jgi:hypothetical protein
MPAHTTVNGRLVDHFHGCPHCPGSKGPEAWYDAGKLNVGACHTHRTAWTLGYNLISSWAHTLEESSGDWDEMLRRQRERYLEIEGYANVGRYPEAA